MGLLPTVKRCFQAYIETNGRASRSEYWYWVLFSSFGGMVFTIADHVWFKGQHYGPYGPSELVFVVLTFLPGFCVSIRRLHDVNRSGYWYFIMFTIIGIIPLLVWFCTKGTTGDNRFGPDPLA